MGPRAVDVGFWGVAPGSETNGARVLNGRNDVFCGVECRAHQRAPGHGARVEQQVEAARESAYGRLDGVRVMRRAARFMSRALAACFNWTVDVDTWARSKI